MDYKDAIDQLDKDIEMQDVAVKFGLSDGSKLKKLNDIKDTLRCCRNELCLYCGKYKNESSNWCSDCRWRTE